MFRISFLIWVVVLAALNLVAYRYLDLLQKSGEEVVLLIGLMPLLDLFILSCYLAVTKRYAFTLVSREEPVGVMPRLAAWSFGFLLLGIALCVLVPTLILELLGFCFKTYLEAFIPEAPSPLKDSLIGVVVGLLMSGPPALLSVILALVGSRYRLVVTPR
ncbi:hypothetical protein [Paludisphaera rhizosphaerae]|uniref:hypothetical protein n=1 Tax=Paludisphaera rhizosphaerae TaxID=2711216 RepID=UPI0013EA2103|nr:hypothetical protein [Paludisphaera rhizosphaerae]